MERLERFTKAITNFMGVSGSKLEKALGDTFPEGERYFGLENFGNTCYCNSVLQVLYFCVPFREHLLEYHNELSPSGETEESLLTCLAELFNQISSQKRRTGVVAPKRFVQRVKKQKELFRSYMHQDAHEFLNFLLNELVDILEKEAKARAQQPNGGAVLDAAGPTEGPLEGQGQGTLGLGGSASASASGSGSEGEGLSTSERKAGPGSQGRGKGQGKGKGQGQGQGQGQELGQGQGQGQGQGEKSEKGELAAQATATVPRAEGGQQQQQQQQSVPLSEDPLKKQAPTWVHDIFQGTLTNETRCLCCETVTARDESFLDLSLDIEQNSSVTACLRNFSSTETLSGNDKFFCDKCCSLQEAQKRMRIKSLPRVLALHLKRFKYIEQLGRYKKLSYRVVFPLTLRLCNTVDEAPGAEAEYSLFAVIVHVGSGPNHGHYVSLIKSHNHWLFFDDENVEPIEESLVQTFFGSSQEYSHSNTDHGYFLFYECLQPELLKASGPA